MSDFRLYGRVFLHAEMMCLTGLHIGGSGGALEIGGVDNPVIRNPLDNLPYIPGSSLKGKMRSQMEKALGLKQNTRIGNVTIHTCDSEASFNAGSGCPVCRIFGVPAERGVDSPTRLVVRDVSLTTASKQALEQAYTDLPYAEYKTEVAIDRVTAKASPRNIERVPAGAVFGPVELVYSVYQEDDFQRLKAVLDALQLVEDDYLGGSGSRGSGKVAFQSLTVRARATGDYSTKTEFEISGTVQELLDSFDALLAWQKQHIPIE